MTSNKIRPSALATSFVVRPNFGFPRKNAFSVFVSLIVIVFPFMFELPTDNPSMYHVGGIVKRNPANVGGIPKINKKPGFRRVKPRWIVGIGSNLVQANRVFQRPAALVLGQFGH